MKVSGRRLSLTAATLSSLAGEIHMSILRPRSRTIGVRVSEEEFANLRQLCIASGARSISDLVRNSMHDILAGVLRGDEAPSNECAYVAQIKNLERRVEKLTAQFALLKARQPPDQSTN